MRFFRRVKMKDLVVFFRQMSVMVRANLPIMNGLGILLRQTRSQYLKAVIADVANEVDGGAKLSNAMAGHPDIFNDFFTNIIRSGETSGRLSEVMDYLADQQEKDYDLQAKIRGAMIYPAFIVVGLLAVGFIVMTFVMPQLTGMLEEAGVKLPAATKVLIFVSNSLRDYWLLILALIILMVGAVVVYIKRSVSGRRFFDALKLKLPVFGDIFRKIYIVRISRSLNTLLKGGVPISPSLQIVRDVVGNVIYRNIIDQAIKEVDEGNSVSESLAVHKEIPIMVSQMISVGEETGKLDEVLERLTDFYSREINNSVNNLSILIEPIIMVILGIAVGFFVAAIIMPMWQLSSSM
ncbi:type II secretion system F family protein [Candidatus Falkowbacteria bacterium]|nr:type II secretion system F family protein [Candidatus Falkowbacteria bacterium]